jgi:hypothetical protein
MTSIKSLNGLLESYNFHINFTTIRVHAKSQFFFENELILTAVLHGVCRR